VNRFLAILILIGCLCPSFAFDEWQGFAEPFPIKHASRVGDMVMLATEGGMRLRGYETDMLFTSEKGLETSSFYGVVEAQGCLYAVSEYGLIAKYEGDLWTVVNRSYLSRKVRVLPGKVVSAGSYIVIPFEDILAFFDTKTGRSLLQVTRIGDAFLSVYRPQDVAVRNDSLYVLTLKATYARKMDWENLSKDSRLVDPTLWTQVETDIFERDSLHVVVKGKSLTDSALFKNGVSRIRWNIDVGDVTYLVGPDAVFHYKDGKLTDLTAYPLFKLGAVYTMQPIPGGGLLAQSSDGRVAISEGTFWTEPVYLFDGRGSEWQAYTYRMKDLSLLDNDVMMAHIWGVGMLIFNELGRTPRYFVTAWENTCMDQIAENYVVAVGTTPAPDKSGFLTATVNNANDSTYGLIYITKDGDVSCASGIGSTKYVGPLVARQDGSDWVVYVSSRNSFDTFANGGVDVIRFKDPSQNGGRLVGATRTTVANIDDRTPVDVSLDEKDSVLWIVSTTTLSYMKLSEDTIYKPNSANGLSGAEYSSIDVDPHGNLWIGSVNQGAYRLAKKGSSLDTLSVEHYTTKNGMMSDGVLDVAVDKSMGMVWFAHENGVTRYRRNDLREAEANMTDSASTKVLAYPIPFRPKVHHFLTIDNIAENARVDIYNRGGSLIRSFIGNEILGGKLEWDGTGKNGRLVAPGVYYYVVRASSKKEKGKILVVH